MGKYDAQNRWKSKNVESMRLEFNKKFCLKCRLEQAAKAHDVSITAYAVAAIEDALQRDGLPRPTPGARQDDNIP